jgi:hypothetical protein
MKDIRRRELAPMSAPESKALTETTAAELEPITHSELTRDSLRGHGKAMSPRRGVVGVVVSRFGSDDV